jgi:hypothetical protein
MTKAKVMTVVLYAAFLFGCATAAPEGSTGMKKISQIPGWREATLQSIEKMMSAAVTGFGYICPTVTGISEVDRESSSVTITCYDGERSTDYEYVQSKDNKWYSVTPTDLRPGISLEKRFQTIITGQGLQCSKVTEMLLIKRDEIIHATCPEGKYKVVKEKTGGHTVSPL